ncbi:MAG: type II toxin-antitoxin system Phd/YefM family antitoxin [Lachnospiraceae bacterium]|nr:type II toxin-antitoxin system Phd/YefM family antitoxin [Lachnospiraceae bacterium]
MIITATEFKTNLGKYLNLVSTEDIIITKNGKAIAKMISPNVSAVNSLRGLLRDVSVDYKSEKEARREELTNHD